MLLRKSKKGTSTVVTVRSKLFETKNVMANPGPKSFVLFVEFYRKGVSSISSVLPRMPVPPVLIEYRSVPAGTPK
jgi:hypothetical protein